MGGSRQWRQARIAAGKCVDCGKPRSATPRSTATRCAVCAQAHHAANVARRARERRQNGILHGPLPFGGAAPRIASVQTVTVRLDRETLRCLETLQARERERFRRDHPTAAPFGSAFGLSRLLRAVIRSFQNERCPARIGRMFMHDNLAVTFHIDAPTRALLDRHARQSFNNNRAATVRAMIVARGRAPYVTGATAGPRRSAGIAG